MKSVLKCQFEIRWTKLLSNQAPFTAMVFYMAVSSNSPQLLSNIELYNVHVCFLFGAEFAKVQYKCCQCCKCQGLEICLRLVQLALYMMAQLRCWKTVKLFLYFPCSFRWQQANLDAGRRTRRKQGKYVLWCFQTVILQQTMKFEKRRNLFGQL